MDEKTWIDTEIKRYVSEYGDVPPWYVYKPNTHPYSIGWRMGGGEGHVMVMLEYWEREAFTREDYIRYFLKYPPPPRWLGTVARCIFDLDPNETDDSYAFFRSYFDQMAEWGITGAGKYEEDMDDPRWLEN